jgi:hypothetical protein
MANTQTVQTFALGMSPFQTLVLGFLGVMTLTGLYLTSRGDPIPMPLQLGFLGGIGCVLVAAYQQMFASKVADNVDFDYFDKQTARKEAKKQAKQQAKQAAEEEAFRQKQAVEARKAEAKRIKQAEDKAKKAALKAAEQAKVAENAKADEAAAAGKKKKKKKAKKPAAAAGTVEVKKPTEEPVDDEWTVAENKFFARKAKKSALEPVLDDSIPTESIYLPIDKKHYKVIIGSGSKNINGLQTLFACKIQLPNKNSSDDTVTITGPPEQLPACKEALLQLVQKGYCKALSGDVTDVTMTVSNVGLLIGPGGKNVGTIRDKTGVEINLPAKEDRKKDEKNKDTNITLVGDLVGIQNAMNAINQLMLQGFCDLTHPDWVKISLSFPGSMLGILLGPKGANLRAIESETETTIKVPNAKTEEDKNRLLNISIVGAVGNVEKARARIAAVEKDFIKKEIDYPTKLLAALIGNKGDNIKKLQSNCNVRINIEEHVWDPDLKTISIEGFIKDTNAAINEINAIVATNSVQEVEFPTSRIGLLIGKSGGTINKIKDEMGVRINVGNHEWDESVRVVTIDGPTEKVATAAARIEALKIPPKREKKEKKAEEAETTEETTEETA